MLSSNEIDNLLASIDPLLLELPSQDEASDEATGDEADLADDELIDSDLLKELNELNATPDVPETKAQEDSEDLILVNELAALTAATAIVPEAINPPTFNEQQLRQRQFELKKAALTFKKHANLATAKQLMAEAKLLDDAIVLVGEGLPLEPGFTLPEVPELPAEAIAGPSKALNSPPLTADKPKEIPPQPTLADQFDSLVLKLEAQAQLAAQLKLRFHDYGDRSNVLRFDRYLTGFQAQIKYVESCRLQPTPVLPQTRAEIVTYSLPQEDLSIGPNVVEVWVGRAWGLTHPQLGIAAPDSFVQYSLGFSNKSGSSSVVYGSADPNYNFTARLGVDGSKAWQRYAERKSLAIEVHHYRGLFFPKWTLGKVSVPLAPLLRQPSLEQIVELSHPTTRRPTGARIEVRIRMRSPILKQPPRPTQQEWIVVLSPSKAAAAQASTESTSTPNGSAPPADAPLPDEAERRAALAAYFDAERFVAKTVMDMEVERLLARSELAPLPAGWDADERRRDLELKLSLLEVKGQLGQLDPSSYLLDLSASLQVHKALAVQLKRARLIDHARQVLVQIKAIQKEVDELVLMGFSPTGPGSGL